jgi:acyl-CoA thioesterase
MLRCMTLRSTSCASTDFDRATTLVPIDGHPGGFSVELDRGWSSLVGVHGGYMCAIAVLGAESLAPDRCVRTLSTSFLRTGQIGPATLSVREVRKGRSITTMVAELSQGGRLLTTSRLTLLTDRPGVEWSAPAPLDLPPPERCVRMDAERVSHFERADGLLDPRNLPFSGGDRARVQGYLRPLEGRPVDSAWLAMATDWFPPPAFVRLQPPTGGVSIDLTTHIHRPHVVLGDDEWLTATFEIENSGGGLAVEHGRVAERDGTLVAESFQTRLTAKG